MSEPKPNLYDMVGAASLVAGPLLMAAGDLIHPKEKMNAAEQVAIVAAHASRWYSAHVLLLAGMLLFIPGVLLLTALAAERKPVAGYLARVLSLAGMGAFAAVLLFEMLLGRFIADGHDPESASDVLDTFQSGAVFGFLAPVLLGFFVGVGLLVFALGSTPGPFRRPVIVLGLGGAFILAEIVSSTVLLSQIGNVLSFIATSWVAWLVIRGRSAKEPVEPRSRFRSEDRVPPERFLRFLTAGGRPCEDRRSCVCRSSTRLFAWKTSSPSGSYRPLKSISSTRRCCRRTSDT